MIMNRKQFLLSALVAGSVMTASAVLMLPEPKLTGEHVSDGKVRITWEFSSEDAPDPYFQVVVYKMHKAAAEENFVLAETDFGYIESEGTMKKHQDRGAIWDCLPDCPGWYVKFPLYMNGALGIDAFQYFPGSDNDDIFGGAYLISPDYDLSNVRDNSVKIEASLGREASSVTGGFCLWTFNTDWWDDKNIDYKPIREHDHHYETLDNEQFNPFAETCQADEYMERTRVMFYGKGRSAYWIDSFRVSADMAPGDSIAYGASLHRVDGQTEFTIDTSADTENDYTYGYEVRAIREDKREYPTENMYMRFISPSRPMKVIGKEQGQEPGGSGIGTIAGEEAEAPEAYYTLQGIRVDAPAKGETVIVRKGNRSYKTIMR